MPQETQSGETNIGENRIKSAETKVNKSRYMHINPIKASDEHLVHYQTLSEVNINQILSFFYFLFQ